MYRRCEPCSRPAQLLLLRRSHAPTTEPLRWPVPQDGHHGKEVRDHLGGFVAGGDPATFFPDLWEWLVQERGVRSVIDVGAGDGRAIDYFERLGCTTIGVEGTPQPHPRIVQHDYRDGPLRLNEVFDLCWCCEFVEHVEQPYIPNFVATFHCAELLLLTHAFPGQPGHHHVNCQQPNYWVALLGRFGFDVDWGLTAQCRYLARLNTFTWGDERGVHHNHFLRSGLAFHRV